MSDSFLFQGPHVDFGKNILDAGCVGAIKSVTPCNIKAVPIVEITDVIAAALNAVKPATCSLTPDEGCEACQ